MIGFIGPLLYLILFNGLVVFFTKKSFGKCFPLTFMMNAFVYFLTEIIFHTFKVGFALNLLFPIVFIVLMVRLFLLKKKDQIKEFKKNYFTNGMVAFLVIYVCIFIFDLNRTFTVWDEWSHWGEMIKEMFRLDRLYSVPASTLMVHKDYPPIVQLFEMFYCQLSGGYNETFLLRCVHLLSFSLFIPAFAEKKLGIFKTIINTLLVVMGVYLLLLFFDQHGIINTIYIDYLMSILIAYLLSIILFEDDITTNFYLVLYSFGFSFLLLMKQMGFPLYLMILFMYVMSILLKNKKNMKEYFKKNKMFFLKAFILLMIIPLVFWKGWNSYSATLDIPKQFNLSDLKITELKGILAGTSGEEWQRITAKNYIHALKTENITTSGIHLSYLQCLILILLLFYIVSILYKKHITKEQTVLSLFTLACGAFGYAFVMLVMYVFSFGPYEGPILASFNRYMSTYVLIAMCFIYMIIIHYDTLKLKDEKKISILLILFCGLFLIQKPEMLEKCFPKIRRNPPTPYEIHAGIISSQTEEKSKIFVIAQNTLGQYQYSIKHYSGSRLVNLEKFNFKIDKKISNYQEYFNKEYKDTVSKYDYLYLAIIDDEFIDKYGFLFEDKNIQNNDLFQIITDGDQIQLKKIVKV